MVERSAPAPAKALSHPFNSLSALWQSVLIALASMVVGLVMANISSMLPIDEVVKRMTTRVYLPVLAHDYSKKGQDAITVMTLDDVDLQAYGLSWPVPLDYYQRLLDRLTSYAPKAVFLDVLFLDDRPQTMVDKFVSSACRASDRGVAVFLATVPRHNGTLNAGSAALIPASNVERAVATAVNLKGEPCVTLTLATISPDKLDHSQWQYPVALSADTQRPSVALGMFCRFYQAQCPTELQEPLALIWATSAAASNAQTMITASAEGRPSTPVCRSEWNGWEAIPFLSLARNIFGFTPLLPLCPYHQVLPIRAFQALDNPTPGFGFSPAEVRTALEGKMVLVGADLVALGDNAISPLHGRLPGVHVHAMALDNLIETNGAYIEDGELGLKNGWFTRTNLFTVVAVFLVAVLIAAVRYLRQTFAPKNVSQPRFWPRKTGLKIEANSQSCAGKLGSYAFKSLLLLPVLLGFPKLSRQEWKTLLIWFLLGLVASLALSYALVSLGYQHLRQGPLVIIDYVLFPLAAGFTRVGQTLAERVVLWFACLGKRDPWAWLLQIHADQESKNG